MSCDICEVTKGWRMSRAFHLVVDMRTDDEEEVVRVMIYLKN